MMQRVSAELLVNCDLETPISGSNCVDTDAFESAFLSAATAADSASNSDQALVYRFLAALCTFHFKPTDPVEPFSNRFGFSDGARSLVGSDFDVEQVTALRAMVEAAGRSDTKISAGGIEATIGLGPMLSGHRDVLEAVFTTGIIFCIENLFVHELGPKVRHSFCHGLTSDNSFYSQDYVYANKLIFSLVMLPLGGSGWEGVKSHVHGKLGDRHGPNVA